MPSIISLDYETFYIEKKYSVKDLGNWRYVHDERFDPYLLTVHDGEQTWAGNPKDLNWDALPKDALYLAHNAGFERAVTGRLIERGIAPAWIADAHWQCTANLTSCIADARSLEAAIWVLEKRRLSKEIRGEMSGKTFKDAEQMGIAGKLVEYAAGDARECRDLWMKYSSRWSSFERELSELTMRQCSRGIRINVPLLNDYIERLQRVLFDLEKGLPWAESGSKPTSPIAIAVECRKAGIPAPPTKTDDEEGFDEWESTYGPRFPWVYSAGKWRSLNKLLTSLETVKERLRPDDTIDFSLLYFGGHTGRWSGGGSRFNMQNLRKVPLYLKDYRLVSPPLNPSVDQMQQWIASCTDYELDIRKILIPRAGKKFLIPDLSQIEPRVLAWLTHNAAMLKFLSSGMNIYEAFARTSSGWTGGRLKDENPKIYNVSKIQVLELGYQAGWKKFIASAAKYGITLNEAQSRQIVADFREQNAPIVQLWYQLDDLLKKSVRNDFEMELPSGRSLIYRDVQHDQKMKKDAEGKWKMTDVYTAAIGNRRFEWYGGKLTENLVQAIARDIFGEHLLELERNLGDVIFHVHDEAIVEADLDVKKEDAEHIMAQAPEWIADLPVASEVKESMHYLK